WMRDCLYNHHMSCPAPQVSTLLPTRVIDVSPTDTPDFPKVLETSRQPGAFIALSHCWGTKTRFVLESNTKTELLRGMAMDVLPPTFRDAIKVTRALGYRYLWIDSLCIMQDSRDDWDYESGRMQEYYTNATLTIALDDTEGDHQGFLNRLRLSDKTATAIPFNISEPDNGGELPSNPHNNESVYLSHNRSRVVPSATGGYLARRGWTLQEDILSVRTVHYEDGRLHWGCQDLLVFEGLACEFSGQGHLKYNFLLSLGSLITGTYHPPWYNIVETYLQRDLTLVEDKFPAISGIAKAVEKRTGFEYRAGIWLDDFHCGLSWFIEGRSEREKTYIAPSWSWASIKTPI
ncbi:HET-domain-containing protein, partial [Hyaloscypha variabilis F]